MRTISNELEANRYLKAFCVLAGYASAGGPTEGQVCQATSKPVCGLLEGRCEICMVAMCPGGLSNNANFMLIHASSAYAQLAAVTQVVCPEAWH